MYYLKALQFDAQLHASWMLVISHTVKLLRASGFWAINSHPTAGTQLPARYLQVEE